MARSGINQCTDWRHGWNWLTRCVKRYTARAAYTNKRVQNRAGLTGLKR